jgi:lipopolysaccharide export system protein LptA
VDITSSQLEVLQKEGQAVFSGNVKVTQGTFSLTAPKVVAEYGGGGQGGSDIRTITATGGTTIIRTGAGGVQEKAVGTQATYTPGNQLITMVGAVTLTRGPSELSGDKLVYDMASGNAKVTNSSGPVKARFVPGK